MIDFDLATALLVPAMFLGAGLFVYWWTGRPEKPRHPAE